ncbi:MAG: type II secretion system F family protein [bacterium]|nr:type II secretion system F family protein [bacterium]
MRFTYEATASDGNLQKGTRDAEDTEAVATWLKSKGLSPLRIALEKKKSNGLSISIGSKITVAEKIFLLKHLSTMLNAGLHVAESIDILLSEATKPFMKQLLQEAKGNIERGLPLSVVFKSYPKYFSPIFTGVIEAGEASGTLEKSLDQLLIQISKEYDLNRKIMSAMAYPIILLSASFLIISLLVTLVLPRLGKMFASLNVQMPAPTRVLMAVSAILVAYPPLTLLVLGACIFGFIFLIKSRRGKNILSVISLKTPIIRTVVQRIVIARMLRILGTLLESGLSIIDAVKLASVSVGHASYRMVLERAVGDIERGIGLSNTLEQYPKLFPRIVTSMMAIGEQTGSLTALLHNLSTFYEEETDQALRSLLSALEPLLLAFMGLTVGGVAISILLPIYKLVGSV